MLSHFLHITGGTHLYEDTVRESGERYLIVDADLGRATNPKCQYSMTKEGHLNNRYLKTILVNNLSIKYVKDLRYDVSALTLHLFVG